MVRTCVVAGCSNIACREKGISIYGFPSDPILAKKWEKMVQRTRAMWFVRDPKVTYICSEHFEPGCLEETPLLMHQLGVEVRRPRLLKSSAIPTISKRREDDSPW